MGRTDKIYAKLPTIGQHAAVSMYGAYWRWLRFGPGYSSELRGFLARESFSASEWQTWQQNRLQRMLKNAAEHVPYYREKWSPAAKAAAASGRIQDIPLLEKEPLRADPEAFVRRDLRFWPRLVFHTSGTTGTPLASIWTVNELRRSQALREARSARIAGVSFDRPRATFSGRIVEPDPNSRGPYYRFNLAERQAYLSPFHLGPDTAAAYVAALRDRRIEWLTGYAVSYYLLAEFILANDLDVPPLKAVITTSEKLTTKMRSRMMQAYGCPIFEEYSTVENTLFASDCEAGRLHVSPDAGLIEILRPDGSACEPGEPGEVVATGFIREAQPLIRFRLGDIASWDDQECACGRALPVLKEVIGRIEDVVVGPDGRQMVRFHGIFVDQAHVREGQIVQESRNSIRVRVVPTNGFGPLDVEDIVNRVQQRLGPAVTVRVDCVDRIPRTSSGKFRAVISDMEPD
jgi:phenylacetate-CoA ligase